MPDAPAPMTASVCGSSSSAHASSVPITRPPKVVPGTGLGTEPVASTTVLASYSVSPTRTFASAVSDPTPSITSMLFFFIRPPTPPVRVLITLRRRSPTAAKSIWRSGTVMPNSDASSISETMSATRSTAFAGMHA